VVNSKKPQTLRAGSPEEEEEEEKNSVIAARSVRGKKAIG
jgi:hypothetical protein